MWQSIDKLIFGFTLQDVEPSRALKTDDPALLKRNARKLLTAFNELKINIMNEPRKGKKLLVLDLDYTILVGIAVLIRALSDRDIDRSACCMKDTHAWKSQNFHAIDFMRPVSTNMTRTSYEGAVR